MDREELSPRERKVFMYLNALRESGITNMFGASPYLQTQFDMNKRVAADYLTTWMKNFDSFVDLSD